MTPTLTGQWVELRPLLATDAGALVRAASDGALWNLEYTVVPSVQTIDAYVAKALQGETQGTVPPFVVTLRETGEVVGTTRFWKVDRTHRKLEIGHTWYAQRWQRTPVNTECKWLLLRYAFEEMDCVRVQFTTDVLNERSRQAILRMGAQQEGIVRNERIMPNGRKRHSVRFSIIDEEWPQVRERLQARLKP